MTPEEKLLKLIRKKKDSSVPIESENGKGNEKKAGRIIQPEKKKGNSLKLANHLLVIIVFIAAGYIGVKYFSQAEKKNEDAELAVPAPKPKAEPKNLVVPETKPFSFYQSVMEQRDIFQSPWDKATAVATAAAPAADLAKQLKLVGIVLDKNPQAVIENVKTKETLFLSVGDSVENAVLQEIHEDKVLFLYNEESVELTP